MRGSFAMKCAVAAAAAVIAAGSGGCGSADLLSGAGMGAAFEANALNYLKQYEAAQSLYQMDGEGCFGSLQELHELRMIDAALYAAWDGHRAPARIAGGYVISDLTAAGGDRCRLSGICVYPVSGRGYVYCALADMAALDTPELRGAYVTRGEEWTMYRGRAEDLRRPLDYWPAAEISSGKLTAYKKYTARESVRRARAFAGQAPGGSGKIPGMSEE